MDKRYGYWPVQRVTREDFAEAFPPSPDKFAAKLNAILEDVHKGQDEALLWHNWKTRT